MNIHIPPQPDSRRLVWQLSRRRLSGIDAHHVASYFPLVLFSLYAIATNALAETSRPSPDQVPLATLDGQVATLRHYQGKITVVNLWATWCAPCRKEMKVFEEAQRAYPNVAIVLINQGETAAKAKDFLSAQNLVLSDVLLDRDMTMMAAVDSVGLPTTTFYDKHGALLESHLGEISATELKSKLDALTHVGAEGIH
ncbi:TlpA family protein disulfide reductase [Pseudomonas oryzihabitans]|uniref:TlpA family protein disulfide reductase n=1 Tax=Pseudomonas oryzihabitans TaxID=47885 RepID=UPI001F525848|nr:TlpA disulfide reductase family protein [Pseudomonas oryzihabitans]MCI1009253.1 TlpA family protein disulfide reductase [Pseudomonas oryzihabitans]